MRTFTLQFEDDGLGEPKRIEFNGVNPHDAFALLRNELEQRRVSLYEGPQLLAVIRRTSKNGWTLG